MKNLPSTSSDSICFFFSFDILIKGLGKSINGIQPIASNNKTNCIEF